MDESKRNPTSADVTTDKLVPLSGDTRPPDSDRPESLPSGTPLTAVFQPNQVLAGRFKVIRFIARGGMGEVYEAEDEELSERVAVKTGAI